MGRNEESWEERARLENRQVGEAIREARMMRGLSQYDIYLKHGIAQSEISKMERGLGNPQVSTLKRLADAMGMRLVIRFEPV